MKKIVLTLFVVTSTALPASMSASMMFTAHCVNGDFAVQTVDPEFFPKPPNESTDTEDEASSYYAELEAIICAEHGSVPR